MNDIIEKESTFSNSNNLMPSANVQIEQQKAIQEVQAALIIAKKFPRDEETAYAKIINACKRTALAEDASYAFPRGGKLVKGASIKLANVITQAWGNMRAGIAEVSRQNNSSTVKAYCWDLETNNQNEICFEVPHIRDKKGGGVELVDQRDIYELFANMGARRKRACVLASVPGYVIDDALIECQKTLSNGKEPIADRIRKLIMAFDSYGVKIEHLEKRLGHKLDATIEEELLTMRDIYNSLKDGMSKREDFFDFGQPQNKVTHELDEAIEKRKQAKNYGKLENADPISQGKE